jgi:hypothetical protein
MAGVKPTNFPNVTPTGTTELYTQTGGVNGKFTLDELTSYVSGATNEWIETVVDVSSSELITMGSYQITLLPVLESLLYYIIDKIQVEFISGDIAFDFSITDILTIYSSGNNFLFEITPLLINIPNRRFVSILDNSSSKLVADVNPTDFPVMPFNILSGVDQLRLTNLAGVDALSGNGTMKVKIRYKIETFG